MHIPVKSPVMAVICNYFLPILKGTVMPLYETVKYTCIYKSVFSSWSGVPVFFVNVLFYNDLIIFSEP